MHSPELTYELLIKFNESLEAVQTKQNLIAYLQNQGVQSFVEGFIDDIDRKQIADEGLSEEDESLLEQKTPLIIYSFDKFYLKELQDSLMNEFTNNKITCQIKSMLTKSWQIDWQKHFKPVTTKFFTVIPPWLAKEVPSKDSHHKIIIEPGLAALHRST